MRYGRYKSNSYYTDHPYDFAIKVFSQTGNRTYYFKSRVARLYFYKRVKRRSNFRFAELFRAQFR